MQGTQRKGRDPTNHRAPAPVSLAKAAPVGLNAAELEAWRTLARVVDPTKVASHSDLVAFRLMAVTLAEVDAARKTIEEEGRDYEVHTESGTVVREHPAVGRLERFMKLLHANLSRFGLTPADREKVPVLNGDKVQDPLDEFSQGITH
jgi:P27 family predicted phage terminase small subunit